MGALTQNKYGEFDEKWRNFTYIYDFRGLFFDEVMGGDGGLSVGGDGRLARGKNNINYKC